MSQHKEAGLESPYLQYPCAQHMPRACGKKQGLVSVFSWNFPCTSELSREALSLQGHRSILPGGKVIFLPTTANTSTVLLQKNRCFITKFEML